MAEICVKQAFLYVLHFSSFPSLISLLGPSSNQRFWTTDSFQITVAKKFLFSTCLSMYLWVCASHFNILLLRMMFAFSNLQVLNHMLVISILVLKILLNCQLSCSLEKGQFYYSNLINQENWFPTEFGLLLRWGQKETFSVDLLCVGCHEFT